MMKGIAIRAGIVFIALMCVMRPAHHRALLLHVAVSLLGGGIWWAVQRDRRHEADIERLLYLFARFVLAAALLTSGLEKVVHIQMPWPSPADWIRPVREMTPLHYVNVWTGASALHETMLGLTELTAGVALLFRQTAT